MDNTPAPAVATAPPRRSYRLLSLIAGGILMPLDLWTKNWATEALHGSFWSRIVLIDGCLDFRLAHNTGGSFSLLYGNVGVITLFSIVALIAVIAWARSLPKGRMVPHIALGLIVGGAIGNLHDRLMLGYVVDFIHAYIRLGGVEYAWPTFNVADSGIVVGVVTLAVLGLFTRQLETEPGVTVDSSEPETIRGTAE